MMINNYFFKCVFCDNVYLQVNLLLHFSRYKNIKRMLHDYHKLVTIWLQCVFLTFQDTFSSNWTDYKHQNIGQSHHHYQNPKHKLAVTDIT